MIQVLFRKDKYNEEEYLTATKYFDVVEQRSMCGKNQEKTIVIPRYSALPYFKELEIDLKINNAFPINSYSQHQWIANFDYYEKLKDHTPETLYENEFPYNNYPGPYVVKGRTNSRKFRWNEMMYAPNKEKAIEISIALQEDQLIANQGILFRKYIPLKTFEIGLNGQRFANEWRFFYLGKKRIAYSYYWSVIDDLSKPKMDVDGLKFADKIAETTSEYTNFFVVDIAEKEEGGWILIELNDGMMSGLSLIDYNEFYKNLSEALTKFEFVL